MFAGCGGSSTTPTATNTTPAINSCTPGSSGCPFLQDTRGVTLSVFGTNGSSQVTWTYTFAGLTVSGTGDKSTSFSGITPGDLEVTGQMTSRGTLGFSVSGAGSNLPGRPVDNSVQSIEGPGATVTCSGVNYFIGSAGTTPQNFRFKFTLDSTSTQGKCS